MSYFLKKTNIPHFYAVCHPVFKPSSSLGLTRQASFLGTTLPTAAGKNLKFEVSCISLCFPYFPQLSAFTMQPLFVALAKHYITIFRRKVKLQNLHKDPKKWKLKLLQCHIIIWPCHVLRWKYPQHILTDLLCTPAMVTY